MWTPPATSSSARGLAAPGQDVDLGARRGEMLGELADVTREPALDQRRVLPGEDQDASHRLGDSAAGSAAASAEGGDSTGERDRDRAPGFARPGSVEAVSVWPRAGPPRDRWSAATGSHRPACGCRGTPSRSPGAPAAHARRGSRRRRAARRRAPAGPAARAAAPPTPCRRPRASPRCAGPFPRPRSSAEAGAPRRRDARRPRDAVTSSTPCSSARRDDLLAATRAPPTTNGRAARCRSRTSPGRGDRARRRSARAARRRAARKARACRRATRPAISGS